MNILFVTTEVAGIFKIGGLADVSAALPVALSKSGNHVLVLLPYYDDAKVADPKKICDMPVIYAGREEVVQIFSQKLSMSGATLLLVRHPKLSRYGGTPIEDTFAFYSVVAASLCIDSERIFGEVIDIVHCHDWHTAIIPLLLQVKYKHHRPSQQSKLKKPKTIITIHNLMYRGVVDNVIIKRIGAPRSLFHMTTSATKKTASLLREGIEYADMVTTVSPTYAKEIVSVRPIDGMSRSLIRKKGQIIGILNGIDTDIWNPSTDQDLPEKFGYTTVATGKPICKNDLLKSVGLSTGKTFLLGFVGRIEPRQKGIDLVMSAFKQVENDKNIKLIILGTGEKNTEEDLKKMANKYPSRIVFLNYFDDKKAHEIYAASDALLVPSKFEPCGLTQLIAMRYGSVPIVRKTGGLADSVEDGVTGYVFNEYSGDALAGAIMSAYATWSENPQKWRKIIHSAMHADFSWERSAKKYTDFYAQLASGI